MGGRILDFSILTFWGQKGHKAPLPTDDVPAEHVRVAPQGPFGPPAPRGPRVEPRGARAGRVRARLPPKNGFDTPPKYVFSPFSLYLQCILSAIHPLYLRHSDVLYRCVFSRYVVRYRSGIGLHAWCLHVLSIQYMRLYRRFSILINVFLRKSSAAWYRLQNTS